MTELFRMIVRIGIRLRAAVSISNPNMPKEASPMMFTTVLSGAPTFAPRARPIECPICVELPQPR